MGFEPMTSHLQVIIDFNPARHRKFQGVGKVVNTGWTGPDRPGCGVCRSRLRVSPGAR